jgi:TonB family protein
MRLDLFAVSRAALCLLAVTAAYPQAADSDPKLLNIPDYVISDEARAAGIDGILKVALTLDKTGSVKQVRFLAGPAWPCGSRPPALIEKVRDSVRDNLLLAKFTPMTKNGEARQADIYLDFKIGRAYDDAVKKREAASRPATVEAGVINGKALALYPPRYPPAARLHGVSGTVAVWVLIDEQGNVSRAGAMSGHPTLHDAARDAACRARFSPTSVDGQAVQVSGMVTYNFVP